MSELERKKIRDQLDLLFHPLGNEENIREEIMNVIMLIHLPFNDFYFVGVEFQIYSLFPGSTLQKVVKNKQGKRDNSPEL